MKKIKLTVSKETLQFPYGVGYLNEKEARENRKQFLQFITGKFFKLLKKNFSSSEINDLINKILTLKFTKCIEGVIVLTKGKI